MYLFKLVFLFSLNKYPEVELLDHMVVLILGFEMQVKTTVRKHLTPISTAIIKNNRKQQALVRVWRKGSPRALLVGVEIGAATVENSMFLLFVPCTFGIVSKKSLPNPK